MTLSSQATVELGTKTRNPLLQRDVLHCILDCLTASEARLEQFSLESRRVLFSLARTCHAFSEPSLDRLWSKLDSLEPLVRCYATVLTEERAKIPPSPHEWVIIRRYSHRIRELSIQPFSSCSQLFLRSTILHPSVLLPNLRILRWTPNTTFTSLSTAFIQRLLGPLLVSLSVTLDDMDKAASESLLANVPFLCPNLKYVRLHYAGYEQLPRWPIETLSLAIPHYEHLECLDTAIPISHVALTHLIMSPKIKKLILTHHPDEFHLRQAHIPSDAIPLRNVEGLSMGVWDLGFITSLLRPQDQMFHTLILRCRSQMTTDALFTFFTALASPQRTNSLETVSLMPDNLDEENPRFGSEEFDELSTHYHISFDTLRPLTSLRRIRNLVIDLGSWFSIHDDDLVSLARNWPLLQILRFDCRINAHEYPWRLVKYVTFKGLLFLLEWCPNLRHLCLPLDARKVPAATGDIVCNPAFTYIDLFNSPIGDPRLVQDILTRHFPTVSEVSCSFRMTSGEDDPEIKVYKSSWGKVNAYLREHLEPVLWKTRRSSSSIPNHAS